VTSGRLLVPADLLALEATDKVISGRRRRSTLYANLEPCLMCLGAAFTAELGTVVSGLESPGDGGMAAFERWQESRDSDAMPGHHLPEIRGRLRFGLTILLASPDAENFGPLTLRYTQAGVGDTG
jgi:tRNA(adenine34) deaminase